MLIIIPLKRLLKLMTHDSRLHAGRPPESAKVLQRHRMPIMPAQDGLEIAALVVDAEIREGVVLRVGPEMRVHIDVAGAHQILQEGVQAMADVQLVVSVHALRAIVVIEVPVQVLAQAVEAVDLMEHVDAPDVGVWAEAEGLGPFGGLGGIFALVEHVLAGDWNGRLSFDSFPGGVDFWRGRLAEDGLEVLFNEGAVESLGEHWDVYQVEYWGW